MVSFVYHELADRAALAALALHPLVLEGERDLTCASHAGIQVRHEFVETRDPDQVGGP